MVSPTGLSSRPLLVVALLLALVWDVECQTCTTTGGTQANGTCVFPFTYNGVTYTSCITVDNSGTAWCAVTNNFPVDRRWGNCDNPTTATTGGNAGGASCVFPFTYNGVSYTTCIIAYNGNTSWCATTNNYPSDQRWGNCLLCAAAKNTPVTTPHITPTTPQQTTQPTTPPLTTAPATTPGATTPVTTPAATTPVTTPAGTTRFTCASGVATVPTTGGNANGANCVFPFQFQNSLNYNCRVGGVSLTPWCATTANWDNDAQWGNCIIYSTRLSSSGASLPCVFPFTYSGSTYDECQLSSQSNLLWCGVVHIVSSTDNTTWGFCRTEGQYMRDK